MSPAQSGSPGASGDTYTHGHHESVLRSHSWRTAENSAAYLLPYLESGQRMLDVGCGPGTITCDLAARVAPGEVIAIDVVADVIAKAEAFGAETGAANVTFQVGDVYALEHNDDSFDVVHAHQVLQHLSDPVGALREMKRVTKPGGVIAVRDADYGGMSWAPEDPSLENWRRVYRAVARRNDAEPDGARHLLRWARKAGFTDVTPSVEAWLFAEDVTREWWSSTWATRVTNSALAEQALQYGLATQQDLEAMADGFRTWAADPDSWFVVPCGQLILRA